MINLEEIKFQKINRSNISFSGHNLAQNNEGEKIYKFFLPKISFSTAQVVLKKFELDEKGNINLKKPRGEKAFSLKQGETSIEINPKDISMSSDEVLLYKFIIDGQEYTDKHKGINVDNSYYNIADLLINDVFETPNSIYHILPNSFNPKLAKKEFKAANGTIVTSDDATARMHHFMRFDSGFDTIIQKIPYIKQLGFRSILSAPIFGQDNISGASYWTNNPYQLAERFGTMDDYKSLQVELFKNSLSFIADGAFSSEGLQGIHYRDILRHGNDSPFVNWFTLDEYQQLGVLPDDEYAKSNFDIKVINSPYIWSVDKDGFITADFGKKNKKYNPNKETFIQLYDRRLTSDEQLLKDEVFTKYDIKNASDPDEITDSSDSIYPYSFPIKANSIAEKVAMAKAQPNFEAKNVLLNWENFSLVSAKESAGAVLWDGNKDIVKLQYNIPEHRQQMLEDSVRDYNLVQRQIFQMEADALDVQKYIIGIGKFWTKKTAEILREYIASQLSSANSVDEFKKIIDAKAGSDLPVSVKYITKQQIEKALSPDSVINNRLQVPVTIVKSLQEYPLEALEVSDDLTSIFSYPSFKQMMKEDLCKEGKIMPVKARHILKQLSDTNLPCGKLLDRDGDISSDNKFVVQLISDDIVRFLILKSLNPEISVQDILTTNTKELKKICAADICKDTFGPNEKRDRVLAVLKSNMAKIQNADIQELVAFLRRKISNITNDKLKIANLIIDKTEAGLNWRIDAAKDIADKDNHKEGRASTKETWEFSKDFWKKFNEGVRLYNNHAYRIGEYTDTGLHSDTKTHMFPTSGILEDKSIEQGGFTTQSNYNYMYSTLLRAFSALPERFGQRNQNILDLICNKLDRGWDDRPGYLFSGSKNNIAYSHAAVANQDKQRIANAFSMNALLAYLDEKDFISKYLVDSYWQDVAKEIRNDLMQSSLNYSTLYKNICLGHFDNIFDKITPRNLAKMASYTDAFAIATKDNPHQVKILNTISSILDILATKSHPNQNSFFYKNFEDTYSDILNLICDNEILAEVKKLQPKVHDALTAPVRTRYIELSKLMVAMPCKPTVYSGDELLETGGEEKAKNVSVKNRGRLHWEYLDNQEYQHINQFKDELARIYNLRNDESLSSLVNGDTILLKKQGSCKIESGNDTSEERGVIGMYRYNDKDDSIILLNNAGFNSSRHFKTQTVTIPKIDLSYGTIDYVAEGTDSPGLAKVGLPKGKQLKQGTVFVDALDENKEYIVDKNGNLKNLNGSDIVLESAITILKRKN